MSLRRRLENRRRSSTFSFECGGLSYIATVGFFFDGMIGEIFINSGKAGSAADVNARDSAIAASIALQHGADLETLRTALTRNADGSAGGPLAMALDLLSAEDGAS
jgi:hypothetical protein